MPIYLMRHGSTIMNIENRVQGHIDCELSDTGRSQAQKAREHILSKGISFDRVYSSPLIRAVETAAIASGRTMDEVERIPSAIEIDFGIHDGECFADMTEETHKIIFDYPSPRGEADGVETHGSLMARVRDFLDIMKKIDPSENVLVVSHGGYIRGVLSFLQGIPQEKMWNSYNIPNCRTFLLTCKSNEPGVYDFSTEEFFEGVKLPSKSEANKPWTRVGI